MEYSVDGKRVHLFKVGGADDWAANLLNNTAIGDQIDERSRVKVRLTPGPHDITVAWIDRGAVTDPYRVSPPIRSSHDPRDPLGIPHMLTFTVTGPYNPGGSGDTPSRQRIFSCRPAANATPQVEEACATRILSGLARRAYRGQATDADTQRLMTFYREARQQGGFEAGIEAGVQRILASPKFVFRVERDPQTVKVGEAYAHHRLRAGVAAGLLPLEQHPRRSAAAGGEPGTAARARRPRARGQAHAGRSQGRAAVHQLRRPVAVPAQPEDAAAELDGVPGLRRQPARRASSTRRGCSSTASGARIATSWT